MNFKSFRGDITQISDYMLRPNDRSCRKLVTVRGSQGEGNLVNFVVSPTTYFVDQTEVAVNNTVTGYYDGNAPAIMIFPPQYPALIMVKERSDQFVKVDHFDDQLVSSDGQLRLNLAPDTPIMLINNQPFGGSPANRDLIVVYGPTTRSIPAQTTPIKIIVWCL